MGGAGLLLALLGKPSRDDDTEVRATGYVLGSSEVSFEGRCNGNKGREHLALTICYIDQYAVPSNRRQSITSLPRNVRHSRR